MKSSGEQTYTSTNNKLLHNLDRLTEIQNGLFRPISIQLAPTDKCNLNCVMCSVKNREMKELNLEDCIHTLQTFKKMGAKTVEITGGGDPTMYTGINTLIGVADSLEYEVGLITNGVALSNIHWYILDKLTWIRISLNSLDYVKDIELDIPEHATLGFSYVWTEHSSPEKLEKIQQYVEKYNAQYVRVVPDCLDVAMIKKYQNEVQGLVDKYPKFFFQQKEYSLPHTCKIGYLKPFVNSDGYVYHCSANALIDRKFGESFRICHISEIEEAWKQIKAMDISHCQEGKCFFKEHNDLIAQVESEVPHANFI